MTKSRAFIQSKLKTLSGAKMEHLRHCLNKEKEHIRKLMLTRKQRGYKP